MSKIRLIATQEFVTNLKRREFLFTAIGLPLFFIGITIVVMLISIASEENSEINVTNVGYIDRIGFLDQRVNFPETYLAYDDLEQARADLDAGALDAYFIVPEAYMITGDVSLYTYGNVSEAFTDQIEDLLTENLATSFDTQLATEFLVEPVDRQLFLENSGRILTDSALIVTLLLPAIFVFIFVMALQLTSTFLMSGIVEEKTTRIIEVLVTSVTPDQLFLGKLLGLGALGLLQLSIWVLIALVGYILFGNAEWLTGLNLPLDLILIFAVYFVLMYFLFASLLAGIGAVSDSEQESRQVAGIVSLLVVLPFFFFSAYLEDSSGTIPTLLTFIPFTSGISVVMRASYGTIPTPDLLISLLILIATTFLITWVSARIFRWALLLYGKRLNLRTILQVLRGKADAGVLASPSGNSVESTPMSSTRGDSV